MAKKFDVEFKMIRADLLEVNDGQIKGVPANPRFIRDRRFEALKQSIADDPEFMQVRELIVYPLYTGKFCIIGGNMRFRAARELGVLNFPCKVIPAGIDSKKIRAFVIKDNVGFGQDDMDLLANDWDIAELASFGMEGFDEDMKALEEDMGSDERKLFKEDVEKDADGEENESDFAENSEGVPDLIFPSDNTWGIPTLDLEMQATELEAPFMSFGYKRGWLELARTLHFYIDDWRFNRVWSNPNDVLGGGIKSIIEPNFSVSHVSPKAFALWCFYKKRWLNCYWQKQGLKTFVDLNVPPQYVDLALTGVPNGWTAFCTRGSRGEINWIEAQLNAAKKIAGKKKLLFVVYSGGKEIEEFCNKNSLIYIEELHNNNEYKK